MKLPIANPKCPTEQMDAEDPLFILYTSGTTGKPKAILHTHGGYMVGVYSTLKYVFDVTDQDRWWCSADPGWITGHSYIVYGPLIIGATSFMCDALRPIRIPTGTSNSTGRNIPKVFYRRLGEARQRRLLLDHRPRGRRHQGERLPARYGGRSRARW